MKQDLSDKRKEYHEKRIDFSSVSQDPFEMFGNWYEVACSVNSVSESYAFTLSTVGKDDFPRGRIVLLREFGKHGFVFYTNYDSQKGRSIEENHRVCMSFFWEKLEQQIIIKGCAEKLSQQMSETYFHKRPRLSQLGALISKQSTEIAFGFDLENEVKKLDEQWKDKEIPKPDYWGGYCVKPVEFEFWQGRPSRLHDRLRYRLVEGNWVATRLAP